MFNVVTSVGRLKNISMLKDHLAPMGITWHVITDEDLGFSLNFTEPWIKSYVFPNGNTEFWARCHSALNWFLDTQEINQDEIYCFLNDDDGYESDFFSKAKVSFEQAKEQHGSNVDIVMVSMLRGQHIPPNTPWPRNHPTSTLYANPQNMRPGSVGLEQILIRGNMLKTPRLTLDIDGDGRFIVQALNQNYVAYAPHIYALFNYFEPGRWDK
jgi:hypothetical protein